MVEQTSSLQGDKSHWVAGTLADITNNKFDSDHQPPDDIDVTIKELHNAGKSQREIARELGKTQATVNRYIKKLGLRVTNKFGGRNSVGFFTQQHKENGTLKQDIPELDTHIVHCAKYEDLVRSGDVLGVKLQVIDELLEEAIHIAHDIKYKEDPHLESGEWEMKILRARLVLGQD